MSKTIIFTVEKVLVVFWSDKIFRLFHLLRKVYSRMKLLFYWKVCLQLARLLFSYGQKPKSSRHWIFLIFCLSSFNFSQVAWKKDFVEWRLRRLLQCFQTLVLQVPSSAARHTKEVVVSEEQFELMLTIFWVVLWILSKTQQFLASMQTFRKILTFSLWNWSPSV